MKELNAENVLDCLSKVKDPSSGKPITEMRMVRELKIGPMQVQFNLVITPHQAPHKQDLNFMCQSYLADEWKGVDVHIHFVQPGGELPTPEHTRPLPQVKNIIAVASGKGGVGKSTLAVNLAAGLKQLGNRVGIVDADIYGPSIPTMLGIEGQRPHVMDIDGKPMIIPLEANGLYAISIGNVIEPEQAVVMRGPRLAGVLRQFLLECKWPELDYLVIDLPPGTGDIQLTLVQTVPVTGAVIVTTPQKVAVSDAIKAMNMFRLPNVQVPVLGIVENMAWFTPQELPDNRYFIFGQGGGAQLAAMGETVLLGQIPIVQGIREAADAGSPIINHEHSVVQECLLNIAREVIQRIDKRNESLPETKVVNLSHA